MTCLHAHAPAGCAPAGCGGKARCQCTSSPATLCHAVRRWTPATCTCGRPGAAWSTASRTTTPVSFVGGTTRAEECAQACCVQAGTKAAPLVLTAPRCRSGCCASASAAALGTAPGRLHPFITLQPAPAALPLPCSTRAVPAGHLDSAAARPRRLPRLPGKRCMGWAQQQRNWSPQAACSLGGNSGGVDRERTGTAATPFLLPDAWHSHTPGCLLPCRPGPCWSGMPATLSWPASCSSARSRPIPRASHPGW